MLPVTVHDGSLSFNVSLFGLPLLYMYCWYRNPDIKRLTSAMRIESVARSSPTSAYTVNIDFAGEEYVVASYVYPSKLLLVSVCKNICSRGFPTWLCGSE